MNARQLELALRKQSLLLRSATLRKEFTQHAQAFSPLAGCIDRTAAGVRYLGDRPQWVALAATALALFRFRFFWRWGKRGFVAWSLWRRARAFLQSRLAAFSFFA